MEVVMGTVVETVVEIAVEIAVVTVVVHQAAPEVVAVAAIDHLFCSNFLDE